MLSFHRLRFEFDALESVFFPPSKPGNILRGAFGSIFRRLACVPGCESAKTCEFRAQCSYARVFEPFADGAPSGFADPPRPFVFRARHLDGARIAPGHPFWFEVNLFDTDPAVAASFVLAFAQLAEFGIGPRRGKAALRSVWHLDSGGLKMRCLYDGAAHRMSSGGAPVRLDFAPKPVPGGQIQVRFVTPTELKLGERLASEPAFPVLAARLRDRISSLGALYGDGPLPIDFKAFAERAAGIRLTRWDGAHVHVERHSSRTGMTHPLGGFVGTAEYEGVLDEFVPYLEAGRWTGVGRQTVFGNGEISLVESDGGLRHAVNGLDPSAAFTG